MKTLKVNLRGKAPKIKNPKNRSRAAKAKDRTVKEEDKARLVGGKDFVILTMSFDSKEEAMSASDSYVQGKVKAKILLKKGWRTLGHVPVSPLTRVFQYRLSDKDRNKGMCYEVARTRKDPVSGQLFYATVPGKKALSFKVV